MCASTVTKPSGSLAPSPWLGFQPITLRFPPWSPRGGTRSCREGWEDAGLLRRPKGSGVLGLLYSHCFWGIPGVWGAWGLFILWLILCFQREMRAAEEKKGSSDPGPFLMCCLCEGLGET